MYTIQVEKKSIEIHSGFKYESKGVLLVHWIKENKGNPRKFSSKKLRLINIYLSSNTCLSFHNLLF